MTRRAEYRTVAADRIIETARRLEQRICERFPGSGLGRVCNEIVAVAQEAEVVANRVGAPLRALRVGIIALAAALCAVIAIVLYQLLPNRGPTSWPELVQGFDAGLDAFVILGGGMIFLFTIEVRRKRKLALVAVHELRAIAHVVDMHQLTKDPERTLHPGGATPSSPTRDLTPSQLMRYLDYCSEMLSLTGKIAALYARDFADPVALAAINEVEDLTNGLSRKIWQKMMTLALLERATPQ